MSEQLNGQITATIKLPVQFKLLKLGADIVLTEIKAAGIGSMYDLLPDELKNDIVAQIIDHARQGGSNEPQAR